jgi:hypothetical protein
VQIGAGAVRGRGDPGEIAARMEERAAFDHEGAEVRIGADLLADALAGHDRGTDADESQTLASMLELWRMRRRVRQLEVTDLAKVAVDRLLGDQLLHEPIGVERLTVERLAGLGAVALDEVAGAPLVARMDDAAVTGRRAPAERVRLDERDGHAAPGQLASRGDAGVAAPDHHDLGLSRQVATGSIR